MEKAPSQESVRHSSSVLVVIPFFIAVFVVFNIFIWMANVSLKELYPLLLQNIYQPERNIIYPILPVINYAYFTIFAFTSIISYLILKGKINLMRIVYASLLLTLILSISFQTSTHLHHFKKEFKKYHGQTELERMTQSNAFVYPFAQYCRQYLQGKHNCQLLSDIDFTEETYMLQFIKLRYYLYPIDIYFNRTSDSDCAILFLKKHATEHVPPQFTAMQPFSSDGLIAIKEK